MLIRSAFVFALCCVPVAALAATPTLLKVDDQGRCTVQGSPTSDAQITLSLEHPAGSSKGFKVKYTGSKRSIVDGPFASRDLIAGYTMIQTKTREEAKEWARRRLPKSCP